MPTKRIATVIQEDGTLPICAWPGGYTLVYTDMDNNTVCPACANVWLANCKLGLAEDEMWSGDTPIADYYQYDEGEDLQCSQCGDVLHSSFGYPCPVCGEYELAEDMAIHSRAKHGIV